MSVSLVTGVKLMPPLHAPPRPQRACRSAFNLFVRDASGDSSRNSLPRHRSRQWCPLRQTCRLSCRPFQDPLNKDHRWINPPWIGGSTKTSPCPDAAGPQSTPAYCDREFHLGNPLPLHAQIADDLSLFSAESNPEKSSTSPVH